MKKIFSIFTSILLLLILSCKDLETNNVNQISKQNIDIEKEKKAILEALNNETKAAFNRDYEGWKKMWVHDPKITKTYINFADSTFSESVGWNKISTYVKTFIDEHPEPEPIPKLLHDIDLRLYGSGAWVSYQLKDSLRGLKRETRLMEKINGSWKIAGMQTTIYGFETNHK
ncbi:hypothetical protein [Aquimarina sp. LLG6339-5]|uniref:hypothetical protein n=1 Tax=Aquimarina sp. LLG6339-5 TaxID=3160830 RepID=UPI00386354CF